MTKKKRRLKPVEHTDWVTKVFGELSIPYRYERVINPAYTDLLDPYRTSAYPLNRLGNFARVTRKYMLNWFNVGKVMERIGSRISDFTALPFEHRFNVTLDALCRAGTESYTSEWKSDAAQLQLEDMIEDTTGITCYANHLLAELFEHTVRQDIQDGKNIDDMLILDLGPGRELNTTKPTLKKLDQLSKEGLIPKDWYRRVTVVLFDIHENTLKAAKSRLKWELDTSLPESYQGILSEPTDLPPLKNVEIINGNFQDLTRYRRSNALAKGIDYVISGAAVMHNTHLAPFFKSLRSFMKNNSAFLCWDWDGGPTWAAPNLEVGHERKVVFNEICNDGEKRTAFELKDTNPLNFSFDQGIPSMKQLQSMKGKRIETTYILSERGAEIVLANFKTLLGLQGYMATHPLTNEVTERGLDGQRISEYLETKFNTGVMGGGFNYIRDFLLPLQRSGVPPLTEPTAYHMIEGYGTNYIAHLKGVGFKQATNFYFEEIDILFGKDVKCTYNPAISQKNAEKLLRFTIGRT